MALLPPHFLNSVVAIGMKPNDDLDAKTQWIGTGFIYGVDADDSGSEGYPFLVTNRHVLEGAGIIVIKMNRTDDLPAGEYPINLGSERHLVTTHPQDLDVAVLPVPYDVWNVDQVATSVIPERQSLSRAAAEEIGVSEGDGVFAIGFPMGLVDDYEDQLFPIVRQGCIARIRDWLSERTRQILIDAHIFPGNSGGPVFLRPSTVSIAGTKANSTSFLIGMVSSYIPYQDVAYSLQTNQARVVFEENSGIAEIVPSDAIMETVRIAMQQHREMAS